MRESLRNVTLQSGTIVALTRESFDNNSSKIFKVIIATWNQPLTGGDLKEIAVGTWPHADFLRDIVIASDDNASLVLASKA